MAANKIFRSGPAALASSAANILSPGTLTGGVLNGATFTSGSYINTYIVLRHIRLVNKTSSAATASLYIGATGGSAAGTEFAWTAYSIPANTFVDWYGQVRLDVTEFLSGLSGTAAAITIVAEGEIGIE